MIQRYRIAAPISDICTGDVEHDFEPDKHGQIVLFSDYAVREQRLRELADRWDTFIDGIGLVGESDSVDCADELRAILNREQEKP